MPHSLMKKGMLAVAILALTGGLAACTATADVSYSEFQLGPGFQAERVHETRIYGDTRQGFGAETCGTAVRRQADAFRGMTTEEVIVCDRP